MAPVLAAQGKAPADAPPIHDTRISSNTQDSRGDWKYLRGNCKIETSEMVLYADEIDYDSVTHQAAARGHFRYENFIAGDKIQADHGVYNLQTGDGTFYDVHGMSPSKMDPRPGILTTTNPFSFEGKWAQRIQGRYIVHDGSFTDCNVPKPWWELQAPVFDIIPDDRAIAHNAVFRLRHVPMFFLPVYYRPLGKNDRQSGFLTPNIGNSSRLGFMLGAGYYWAINRSYDAMYRAQYFTSRGLANTLDFRGKPTQNTDFSFGLYGVNDKGIRINNGPLQKQGGYQFELTAKADDLPGGFTGRLDYNFLSSYLFRQSFTQTFNEAIFSEVDSVGYLQRHWTDYAFTASFERQEVFESTTPGDRIVIQKLPSFDLLGRDEELLGGPVPVWFSFDSSVALLRRQEPAFQTSNVVDRETLEPRAMTAFSFKDFHLLPSVTLHGAHYGDSLSSPDTVSRNAILRRAGEFDLDLIAPTLERVFPAPKWLGQKMKHVIEARASYRYVNGVQNFNDIIRFDEDDLLTDTNQLELSLTNRLYVKDKNGNVNELLSWQVVQERYFDPTFGGAVLDGQRNVFLSSEEITPFAFIAGPRNYSPVDSILRLSPIAHFGADWRTDYDPLLGRFVNDTISANVHFSQYFVNAGYREIKTDPVIEPTASQVLFTGGYGDELRRGWNGAVSLYYDYRKEQLEYATTQFSYNTNCCGFSVQYRRFAFGVRNENQFRFSFALANIGSVGTLRRQDRIF